MLKGKVLGIPKLSKADHKGLNVLVDDKELISGKRIKIYVDVSSFDDVQLKRVNKVIGKRKEYHGSHFDATLHHRPSLKDKLKGCTYDKYVFVDADCNGKYLGVNEFLDVLSDILYTDTDDSVVRSVLVKGNPQCDTCIHMGACIDSLLPYDGGNCTRYCGKQNKEMLMEMFGIHVLED